MKNLLELKSSLGHIHLEEKEYEVYAAATATYDFPTKTLTVALKSYLHENSSAGNELRPSWLPHDQIDREHVEHDEATDLGREIFARWRESIKHSAPTPLH